MTKGPQTLPLEFRELLFKERLDNILRGLCERPMTSKWKDLIASKSLAEWAFLGMMAPWSEERLDYTGASSHNPLKIDVVEPRNRWDGR